MWLKNDNFENFCPSYLTYQLSKNKNPPIKSLIIRVEWKVHHNYGLAMMIFTEIICQKNIVIHPVTLSIPKVAKYGQKVPFLDNFRIWVITLA